MFLKKVINNFRIKKGLTFARPANSLKVSSENYFFLETMDQITPVNVITAPESSVHEPSSNKPFAIKIPPIAERPCLIIPKICSCVMIYSFFDVCLYIRCLVSPIIRVMMIIEMMTSMSAFFLLFVLFSLPFLTISSSLRLTRRLWMP